MPDTPSAALAAQLAKPSASYKNSARAAVAGLLLFMGLYCALAGWFLWTAWQVVFDGAGSDLGGFAYLLAAVSLFLGVFMVKAVFSVKNARPDDLHEVTAEEQPRLFAFLFALADAAKAPRPHKVYLSARVNAAVFYDLSLFNLIFPSRKNLEIGLALVNTLNLGELRAVLAHEFGHFAQRSMAVGRWVYVAQQIATHLVTRRDKLDDLLVTLGNVDLRVRAGVAVVQLIIWSIRSLVESLFQLVLLMQRALSREMEMQADLVAVALTGSDALVHALHRTQGADDAWDRALHFLSAQRSAGKATRDVFSVQTHILARMSAILSDGAYAKVPPLPAEGAGQHRVFKAELAQPPRMWLTHPLNHEREANAKRLYVPAAIDPASAWSLFQDPAGLRHQMTARLLGDTEAAPVPIEESLEALASQFRREQYQRRYCGVYFGRALTRHAQDLGALRSAAMDAPASAGAALYPASLSEDMRQLRALEGEHEQLRALIAGNLTAPGGVVHLRGTEFRVKQLPSALERVQGELDAVQARLRAHDHLCRSWHQGLARAVGGGWQAYLDGLLALIHYAEHTKADLQDAHGVLQNTVAVVTATRKVSSEGISRLVQRGNDLHHVMGQIYALADQVVIEAGLGRRIELDGSWSATLGQFTLPLAQSDNIGQWLDAVDGWVGNLAGWLEALRGGALEQLLEAETAVVAARGSEAAPPPSRVPAVYPLLLEGTERKRQTRLDWWARFQRADGYLAGGARLAVAGAIVAAVLGVGHFSERRGTSVFSSEPVLLVYNGLSRNVVVQVDGQRLALAGNSHGSLPLPGLGTHMVETRTAEGQLIEQFEAPLTGKQQPVYNVAAASPMVLWQAAYGSVAPRPEQKLGAPRWFESAADHIFTDPPEKVSGKGSGSYRSVLSGAQNAEPGNQLALLDDKEGLRVVALHARWDDTGSALGLEWLGRLAGHPEAAAILAARLQAAPDDVVLRRTEFDIADEASEAGLCSQADVRAAAAPDDGNRAYLRLRCRADGPEQSAEFRKAHARWPGNPWLGYAAAYDLMEAGQWQAAAAGFEKVRGTLPQMAPRVAVDLARMRRMQNSGATLDDLLPLSSQLRMLVALDKGEGPADSPMRAYAALARGELGSSLAASSGDAGHQAHVLRLVAASEGAGPDATRRALALPPDQGHDLGTIWSALALAMRNSQDTRPYAALAAKATGKYAVPMQRFLSEVHSGRDPRAAERLLATMPPDLRAHAYVCALMLAGDRAPPAWRDYVRRMLFASERPYFRPS